MAFKDWLKTPLSGLFGEKVWTNPHPEIEGFEKFLDLYSEHGLTGFIFRYRDEYDDDPSMELQLAVQKEWRRGSPDRVGRALRGFVCAIT